MQHWTFNTCQMKCHLVVNVTNDKIQPTVCSTSKAVFYMSHLGLSVRGHQACEAIL